MDQNKYVTPIRRRTITGYYDERRLNGSMIKTNEDKENKNNSNLINSKTKNNTESNLFIGKDITNISNDKVKSFYLAKNTPNLEYRFIENESELKKNEWKRHRDCKNER